MSIGKLFTRVSPAIILREKYPFTLSFKYTISLL